MYLEKGSNMTKYQRYYIKNRDNIRAKKLERRKKYRGTSNDIDKLYYQKNREKILARKSAKRFEKLSKKRIEDVFESINL